MWIMALLVLGIGLYFLNRKTHSNSLEVVWQEKYWITNSTVPMSNVAVACDLTISEEEAGLSVGELLNRYLRRQPRCGDTLNEYGVMFLVISDVTDTIRIYPRKNR